MMQSQYSLSWDSYKTNVCSGFSSFQQNGDLVDMTLAADGHFVKVHKVLIALASPYIKDLISTAPCQHPVIFLNNVSHSTLCLVLEYIYTGQVVVPSINLPTFIETAKSLHIKGLENMDSDGTPMPEKTKYQHSSSNNETGSSGLKRKSIFSDEITLPANAKRVLIKEDDKDEDMLNIGDHDVHDYSTPLDETDLHESDDNTLDSSTGSDKPKDKRAEALRSLQFTVSIRGSLQVILNRYMYNLHSTQASGTKRWRCIDYRNNKCMAFIVTHGNVVLSRANLHSHSFHDKKILAKIEKNAVYSAIDDVEGYRERERERERKENEDSEFAVDSEPDCGDP